MHGKQKSIVDDELCLCAVNAYLEKKDYGEAIELLVNNNMEDSSEHFKITRDIYLARAYAGVRLIKLAQKKLPEYKKVRKTGADYLHWAKAKSEIFKADKRKTSKEAMNKFISCLLYTSPSPRDQRGSRMPSSA